MMQIPVVQPQQSYPLAPQPNYNAVKIDINNPSVNAPAASQCQAPQAAPVTSPIYGNVPTASVYEMPQVSAYPPQAAAQPMPSVPQPVIIPPTVAPVPALAATPAPVATAPVQATPAPAVTPAPVAPVQAVEVKAPEATAPKVDVNAFISKLSSADYEQQATAMESIADLAQNSPKQAAALLDVKVIDTLLGIMQADSSKLAGPTPAQLQIREKIMGGKPVTEAETVDANKISPMELSERNKQYSIYTVAILQKLYGSEVEKISNTVVPLTELPGAAGIVEQIKSNPNPMVRASAIDALSYIQRPEYKQDLNTLFTVAKKDKDTNVQQAATKAMDKLAQVATAPAAAPAPVAAPAKEAVKPEAPKKA